jgi:aminoglycoside/choline kinase family phosphotransferase
MPHEPSAVRQLALEWLDGLGMKVHRCEPLRGDVSARRYFRVALARESADFTAIVAYYPEAVRESLDRFSRSTALLKAVDVSTPRILATAAADGLMLLEDLGTQTLYDHRRLSWDGLRPFLEQARSIIDRIHGLDPKVVAELNPPLNGDALRRELDQTWELFLLPEGLCGNGGERRRLADLLDDLCAHLDRTPSRPSHRDFMARNLLPLESGPELAVIDHQDLRLAPAAYDAASLLNDSLYPPDELSLSLLGDLEAIDYHRCAAQRTLKIIGTFVKFARAGSDRYLPLVPVTLRRCIGHLRALPEADSLSAEVARWWEPVLQKGPSDSMLTG